MEQLSDEKLIARYLRGDEAALEALVKRYLPLVYGFATRYTGNPDNAADIAQETFVKVWKNIRKFDQKRSFKSWIFTIAKNTALDWLKKKKEPPFSAFETNEGENPLENIADTLVLSSIAIDQKILAAKMDVVIQNLPKHYHTVVTLREKEQLSFREIAKKLHAPLNTVKSRYRRALHILKGSLNKKQG